MQKKSLKVGDHFTLGKKAFNQEEIFEFAQTHDPLPFHLNVEAAEKSRFKGLICSGGQAFYYFYPKAWVPMFGESVIAGMGLKDWNFIAPIYVNDEIQACCEILNIQAAKRENEVVIDWLINFTNESGKLVQNLHLIVLHKK